MASRLSSEVPTLDARPGFPRADTDINNKEAKQPLPDSESQNHSQDDHTDKERIETLEKYPGVAKIEALYVVFGKGTKLWILWFSIGLISCAYALSDMTTYYYVPFATSAFGEHTVLGTISVITAIMAGVAKPFIAKLADLWSRPVAIAFGVIFYTIGYIVVAASKTVADVAAGEVIYTLGNTALSFVQTILLGDITSLQYRGLVNGLVSLPYIPFAFVAGNIAEGLKVYTSTDGWRWGFGMFTIIIPATVIPAVLILFWADRRAKKVGALSLASSTYARERVLAQAPTPKKPLTHILIDYARKIDAVGLLLLGFAFGCILTPFTLSSTAIGGYTNPSLIALLVVGGILFIATIVWEWRFASHPIMPLRIFNRTFICAVGIDFMYYFSGYLSDAYWSSWLWVARDYDSRDYTYILNILTVGLCGLSVPAGLIMKYTHRFKYLQISGLCFRILGMGLNYLSVAGNGSNAVIVSARVFISTGGAISVISSQVAAQASVPHNDLALAASILALWTSVGGAIGSAIAASVWNRRVPMMLEKYVGDYYNQNATALAEIFGSIYVARAAEPRALIVQAYDEAIKPLYLAALLTSFVSLIFGFFTKNYVLDDRHNAVEDTKINFRSEDETAPEVVAAKAREAEARVAERLQQEGRL
ncbi:uncharacterized protein I206_103716 [Kwoniella pini CBS 10737]|uniref:Siderophore-iron transporter Str1 n=1 Tax=Kwoniella pini CBS 10737 TaxID=1296096 RepID=A0A1B9I8Z2_9TREE|nr:siderophore-iron transporter Str1 [Kwoniella pini CBS 10737]OCF51999.1 siderophore-iron transporter Str1 [Kwoniella pini CBS 10737]